MSDIKGLFLKSHIEGTLSCLIQTVHFQKQQLPDLFLCTCHQFQPLTSFPFLSISILSSQSTTPLFCPAFYIIRTLTLWSLHPPSSPLSKDKQNNFHININLEGMDKEEVPSVPSTPATPGTPGAPLFGGLKFEKPNAVVRKSSFLKSCKCFNVEEWSLEDGAMPRVSCSLPAPHIPLAKMVGAEFIGTFILMFAGIGTAIVNQKTHGSETLIGCAAANGLAVMIIIFSTGHISGAHLNPAVTISFAALKHFPWKNVPVYIGTQILASVSAAFALKAVFHPFMSGGVTVPSVGYGQAFATEFIVSFILMFVVTAVATDTRAMGELAGITVGGTVMLNILIAGPATGSSMNPVRTLGPAIAANNYKGIWVYLIAPILGTLCGAGAYTVVKLPEEEAKQAPSAHNRSFRR